MEDEELPSESTSRPIFRRNVNKTISLTKVDAGNSSSSKVLNKNVKSTSATTKRTSPKTKKQSDSRKKNHIFNQHEDPKYQQQYLTITVVLMTICMIQHQYKNHVQIIRLHIKLTSLWNRI